MTKVPVKKETPKPKPVYGLLVAFRPYRCMTCTMVKRISTNHTGNCMDYCDECSCKGLGFGRGVYLFGTVHRVFEYVGEKVRPDEHNPHAKEYRHDVRLVQPEESGSPSRPDERDHNRSR